MILKMAKIKKNHCFLTVIVMVKNNLFSLNFLFLLFNIFKIYFKEKYSTLIYFLYTIYIYLIIIIIKYNIILIKYNNIII